MKNQIDLKTLVSKTVHELSNPLAIITGRLQLLNMEITAVDPCLHKSLESMSKATQRLCDIMKELKSVANLAHVDDVLSSHELLWALMPEIDSVLEDSSIKFLLNLGEDTPLRGDKKQLIRAVVNLLHNAAEASDGLAERWISLRIYRNLDRLIIEVEDSAPRIAPEFAQLCFHPFFTTKKNACASGMGLTISQYIVNYHGGEIYVDPLKEHTTFVISLPLNAQESAA
jgi:signal transduction histidine kinase